MLQGYRELKDPLRTVGAEVGEPLKLHTPLTRDTANILSAERLDRLKQGAYVLHGSRPELID